MDFIRWSFLSSSKLDAKHADLLLIPAVERLRADKKPSSGACWSVSRTTAGEHGVLGARRRAGDGHSEGTIILRHKSLALFVEFIKDVKFVRASSSGGELGREPQKKAAGVVMESELAAA
jgi:hypothetical protein